MSAIPQGWKLVPVEPTPEMLNAASSTPGMKAVDDILVFDQARRGYQAEFPGEGSPLAQAYRAMLSAAPLPPAETVGEPLSMSMFASKADYDAAVERDAYAAGMGDPLVTATAAMEEAVEALDQIGGLSRALRNGGPDPSDLEELSDALSEAVNIAHAAISKLEAVKGKTE